MSLRLTTRAAAAGASLLVAAGALAAAGPATAADEVPSTAYTCTIMGQALPLIATPTAAVQIPALASGYTIDAGLGDIGVAFTIPQAVLTGLHDSQGHVNAVGVKTDDFGFRIGSVGTIPVTSLSAPTTALPSSGDLTLPTAGKNGKFTLPAAGTYDLLMPSTFTVVLPTDTLGDMLTGPCTLAGDSPVLGSMTINPQDSFFAAASGPKTVKKGKVVNLTAVVNGAFKTATGKVVAKEGKKTVGTGTLKKGKATIPVKGLKPGTHTFVLSYAGDASTNPAGDSTPITVTVKK